MNHDPMRFCFECKQMKPAKDFRPLSRTPGKQPRSACAQCFDRLEKIRVEHLVRVINR